MNQSEPLAPERSDAPAPARLADDRFDAVILDLDGVVTDTAEAHAAAWKQLFDAYRQERADRGDGTFEPFDPGRDYREHVDGKPRYDGVRHYLASRDIELPEGTPEDGADDETVCGLGNRKNGYFRQWLAENHVRAFPDAVAFLRAVRAAGLRTAIISASKNCAAVLENAGVGDLFDTKVDGVDMAERGLPGKPDPAIFLRAADAVGVAPARAAVVEDAIAGVAAGARGGFALVVGINRGDTGQTQALRANGADIVVGDLRQLLDEGEDDPRSRPLQSLPSLWDRWADLSQRLREGRPVIFLDYDGTLTPIVEDPTKASLNPAMKSALSNLADRFPVAVISGRDLDDVRSRVGIDTIFYAGSHGFDIAGPGSVREVLQRGREFLPELGAAENEIRARADAVDGAVVERKKFSIAIHYRKVPADAVAGLEDAVDRLISDHPTLRKSVGKKVFQIQPDMDWDKGRALLWLLDRPSFAGPKALPLYIGDDVTDEDAFAVLSEGRGVAVVVREGGGTRRTAAEFALDDVADVRRFLERLSEPCRTHEGEARGKR